MLVLDSSAVLEGVDPRAPSRDVIVRCLNDDRGPLVLPASTLGEITYLVSTRLGPSQLAGFVADLSSGAFTVDCGDEDYPRIEELVRRYADLPLSFTDAAVIACAERRKAPVVSVDNDFSIVAREGTITVVP